MYELRQNIERARIDKEQDELKASTEKDIARVKAEEQASVMLTRARGQQNIVVNEVKADTVTLVNEAKTEAQKLLIKTEQQVAVMGIEASTENQKTKARYDALIQECEAEKANLVAIDAQRQHDYEMKKANAYEELSSGRSTKIVMSGSSGESLISRIFDLQ